MNFENELYHSIFADRLLTFLAAMSMFYLVITVIVIISWPIVMMLDSAATLIKPLLRRHAIKIIILHYSFLAAVVAFTILAPLDQSLKEVIIVSAFGYGLYSWFVAASYLNKH